MRLPAREYRTILRRVPILCVDGIIVNRRGQVLLVKRKNEPFRNRWWVPGGRVLKGETLEQAFRRKMREELGIAVKVLAPVGYYEGRHARGPGKVRGGVHAVSVVFRAAPRSLRIRLDGQSAAWGFFDRLPGPLRRLKRFEGRPRP